MNDKTEYQDRGWKIEDGERRAVAIFHPLSSILVFPRILLPSI
jgi:hypothetical protein